MTALKRERKRKYDIKCLNASYNIRNDFVTLP